MPPPLPKGVTFVRGAGAKKYTAVLPGGRRVSFGHKSYQQYRDAVPRRLGGGLWTKLNHNDRRRRAAYRRRAAGMRCKDGQRCIDRKFSPAWFSYHFLW